jgi:quinol monooxygenase YgiN
MSSHVVMTFQAKPDQVEALLAFLIELQDRLIDAGAITASLLQDEDDPSRMLEEEVWQSADAHKRFVEAATTADALESINALLLVPFQVNYLDTVKYTRNRRL